MSLSYVLLAETSVPIKAGLIDCRLVTFPVPGNDDTPSAVRLYCQLFKQAVLAGKSRRAEDEKTQSVTTEGDAKECS